MQRKGFYVPGEASYVAEGRDFAAITKVPGGVTLNLPNLSRSDEPFPEGSEVKEVAAPALGLGEVKGHVVDPRDRLCHHLKTPSLRRDSRPSPHTLVSVL